MRWLKGFKVREPEIWSKLILSPRVFFLRKIVNSLRLRGSIWMESSLYGSASES